MRGNRNTEEHTKKKEEEKKQEKKQEEKGKNIRMVSPWFFCFLQYRNQKLT